MAHIIRTLIKRRVATAVALLVAIAGSAYSAYSVSLSPLGLKERRVEFGAATTQILIDSPRSALADINKDTAPLAVRALVYTQFLSGISFRHQIARAAGMPNIVIDTEGPFTTLGVRPNIAKAISTPQSKGPSKTYRLVFDAQQDLPVIDVYSQAPTPEEAVRLADASVLALRHYVDSLQTNEDLPDSQRVIIRSLGPAQGGLVNAGTSLKIMILTFLGLLALGIALIMGGNSVAREFHSRDAEELTLDVAPAEDENVRPASLAS